MKRLLKSLQWLDNHIMQLLLMAFIFVITLYPKIPLINLTYTYIAIRAEDFFVAAIFLVFGIQLLRKKESISFKVALPFILFWLSITASLLSGIFLTKSIIHENIAILHTLRRFEYMGIFFIAFSTVKSFAIFKRLLLALITSTVLVCMYGIGQRFVGFPAVSTMNAEFAKGIFLTLTPEARLASTFAGHYDLAAYIIFLLPIFLGVLITLDGMKGDNLLTKYLDPFIKLYDILTAPLHTFASRIRTFTKSDWNSFMEDKKTFVLQRTDIVLIAGIAFLASCFTASIFSSMFSPIIILLLGSSIVFLSLYYKYPKSSLLLVSFLAISVLIFTASRTSFIAYVVSTSLFLLFFKKYKYFITIFIMTILLMTLSQSLSDRFLDTFQIKRFLINERTGEVHVVQGSNSKELPAGTKIIHTVSKSGKESNEEKMLREKFLNEASIAAQKDGTSAAVYTEVSGLAADTSTETRLRVEWPRAIERLMENPLLGVGASAVDKEYSTGNTDNDYLRWLAEFGILGTLAFLYVLYSITEHIFSGIKYNPKSYAPLFYGPLFGLFGLMINAGYIDVFEASKVAFVVWFTLGIFVGVLMNKSSNLEQS